MLSWTFLDIIEKITFVSGKKARFHVESSLCLIRMSPDQSYVAIQFKNESLEEMLKAITSRIPLVV